MGRALATAHVLVLDRSDGGRRREIKEALCPRSRIATEGQAILVVSGELEDLRTCDRVLVMRHGEVVAEHQAGWTHNALVASVEGIEHWTRFRHLGCGAENRPGAADQRHCARSAARLALLPAWWS